MTETIRPARPSDEAAVLALLEAADLPTDEVSRWLSSYVVAEGSDGLAAVAGLEVHGSDGVLRSVAVDASRRGQGLGGRLTEAIIGAAREADLERLYLLTTTAEDYFPRHGFRRIDRQSASEAVQASVEFREACPDTATAMVLELQPRRGR